MTTRAKIELGTEPDLTEDFPPVSPEEWQKAARSALKGENWTRLQTPTHEGIALDPLYRKLEEGDMPGIPGYPDFRRGTRVTGYLRRPWGIVQEFDPAPDPGPVNRMIRSEIERGLEVIRLPLGDQNRGIGTDYLKRLLDGVDLSATSLIVSGGISPLECMLLISAAAPQLSGEPKKISVTYLMDPLARLMDRGFLEVSPETLMDRLAMALEWSDNRSFQYRLIGVDGAPFHDGGGSIVQQAAGLIAGGVYYLDQMLRRGLDVDPVCRHIHFNLQVGPFYFMEIAGIRALRMAWSRVVRAFGGSPKAQKARINAQTSSYFHTRLDPAVNMLRSTTESFSAVVAGVDTLQTRPYRQPDPYRSRDEEFGRRLARNIQLILREECHMDRLIDPAAGSYYVERITRELAQRILEKVRDIDAAGGLLEVLRDGRIQAEIRETAASRRANLRKRKEILVGTNRFVDEQEDLSSLAVSPAPGKRGPEKTRQETDPALASLYDRIDQGLNPDAALDPAVTFLEDGHLWKPAGNTTRNKKAIEAPVLQADRLALPFEEFRSRLYRYQERRGGALEVRVLAVGAVREYRARADFAVDFFRAAGLKVIFPGGFEDAAAALVSGRESRAAIAVICSSDERYPRLVRELAGPLKETRPDMRVVLAGHPRDREGSYRQAGVDDFIFQGSDLLGIMENLIGNLEVAE